MVEFKPCFDKVSDEVRDEVQVKNVETPGPF